MMAKVVGQYDKMKDINANWLIIWANDGPKSADNATEGWIIAWF